MISRLTQIGAHVRSLAGQKALQMPISCQQTRLWLEKANHDDICGLYDADIEAWWATVGPNDLLYCPAGCLKIEKTEKQGVTVGIRTGVFTGSDAHAVAQFQSAHAELAFVAKVDDKLDKALALQRELVAKKAKQDSQGAGAGAGGQVEKDVAEDGARGNELHEQQEIQVDDPPRVDGGLEATAGDAADSAVDSTSAGGAAATAALAGDAADAAVTESKTEEQAAEVAKETERVAEAAEEAGRVATGCDTSCGSCGRRSTSCGSCGRSSCGPRCGGSCARSTTSCGRCERSRTTCRRRRVRGRGRHMR